MNLISVVSNVKHAQLVGGEAFFMDDDRVWSITAPLEFFNLEFFPRVFENDLCLRDRESEELKVVNVGDGAEIEAYHIGNYAVIHVFADRILFGNLSPKFEDGFMFIEYQTASKSSRGQLDSPKLIEKVSGNKVFCTDRIFMASNHDAPKVACYSDQLDLVGTCDLDKHGIAFPAGSKLQLLGMHNERLWAFMGGYLMEFTADLSSAPVFYDIRAYFPSSAAWNCGFSEMELQMTMGYVLLYRDTILIRVNLDDLEDVKVMSDLDRIIKISSKIAQSDKEWIMLYRWEGCEETGLFRIIDLPSFEIVLEQDLGLYNRVFNIMMVQDQVFIHTRVTEDEKVVFVYKL